MLFFGYIDFLRISNELFAEKDKLPPTYRLHKLVSKLSRTRYKLVTSAVVPIHDARFSFHPPRQYSYLKPEDFHMSHEGTVPLNMGCIVSCWNIATELNSYIVGD